MLSFPNLQEESEHPALGLLFLNERKASRA